MELWPALRLGWLFGLRYEYVRPGDRLLDVGIATGLSSLPFARAGAEVYGCDESPRMLAVCQAKGFAAGLKGVDVGSRPWPYTGAFFHHIVACGVFHFQGDLEPAFAEIARIARPGATLAFTTWLPGPHDTPQEDACYVIKESGGACVCLHRQRYVAGLLARHGLAGQGAAGAGHERRRPLGRHLRPLRCAQAPESDVRAACPVANTSMWPG